jgi:glycine hydroxymethyltransferase
MLRTAESSYADAESAYTFFDFANSSSQVQRVVDIHRQLLATSIHLVASGSYPFPDAMRALAEPMSIFPLEGILGGRYLPASDALDVAEAYGEELLQKLFATGKSYRATIQPHSGTQANQIVFNATLRPDDIVLSLAASSGGHISHSVLIGRRNRVVHYPLNSEGLIDYDALECLAMRYQPRLIIAGGSAYPRQLDFARLALIARRCDSFLHADISHIATFIAGGIHPSPFGHADFISFNMMKNLRGPNGGILMLRREHYRRAARALFPDTQGGGNENAMFAKVVALECLARIDITAYAQRMVQSARLIARTLQARDVQVVTGGTDSHMVLVDLRSVGGSGADVERECTRHGVLVNRNLVPNDDTAAEVTSGVRMGTACVTILDYSDADLASLADWLADRMHGIRRGNARQLVEHLVSRYNRKLFAV